MTTPSRLDLFYVFICFFALGLPVDGILPSLSGRSREYVEVVISNNISTAIFWAGLYVIAAYKIAKNLDYFLVLTKNNILLFVVNMVVFLSFLWSPNVLSAAVGSFQIVGAYAVAACTVYIFRGNLAYFLNILSSALVLNIFVNIFFILLVPELTINYEGRWAGVVGNPNYLGSIIVCAIWANLSINHIGKNTQWVKIFASLIMLFFAYKTGSATSIIVILSIFTFFIIVSSFWGNKVNILTRILVFMIISSIGFIIFLLQDLFSFISIFGRSGDLTGRTLIWEGAIDLIISQPLHGYGIGADTYNTGLLHWATTFHNGFLQVGVISGVFVLAIFLKVIFSAIVSTVKIGPLNAYARTVFIFIFSFILYNMSESTAFLARNPIWLVFLVLLLFGRAGSSDRLRKREPKLLQYQMP